MTIAISMAVSACATPLFRAARQREDAAGRLSRVGYTTDCRQELQLAASHRPTPFRARRSAWVGCACPRSRVLGFPKALRGVPHVSWVAVAPEGTWHKL